jgi:hypothetical protein
MKMNEGITILIFMGLQNAMKRPLNSCRYFHDP